MNIRSRSLVADSVPGDRHPSISQSYPPDAFYHNGQGGRVLDVTKPPFNAKGDGVTDDTQALIAAMRFVREHYEILQAGGSTYCSQKFDRNWIVYLPDGEYLVSDTISQGWPALAMHILNGWGDVRYFRVESPEHEEEMNAVNASVRPVLHGTPVMSSTEPWIFRRPSGKSHGYSEVCIVRTQLNAMERVCFVWRNHPPNLCLFTKP